MKIAWEDAAWEQYLYWQKFDKKIIKRINILLKDIQKTPFAGIGKPEPLKHAYQGFWSRRINTEHRLVYTIIDDFIIIAQCRYHY